MTWFSLCKIKSNKSAWLVEEADLSWLMRLKIDLIPQTATHFSPQRKDRIDGFIDSSFSLKFNWFSIVIVLQYLIDQRLLQDGIYTTGDMVYGLILICLLPHLQILGFYSQSWFWLLLFFSHKSFTETAWSVEVIVKASLM